MQVLVIEDDEAVAGWVDRLLTEAGHEVTVAATGDEGERLAVAGEHALAIVDLSLPGRSGLAVINALRQEGSRVPVIVMTGRADDEALVAALDAGADDYVVKPVSGTVLLARVRAALRRGGAGRPEELSVGPLALDRITRRLTAHGREIDLAPRELTLLEYLMLRPDEVVTRAELLERVWGTHFETGTNLVDVAVSRLRRKLSGVDGAPAVRGVRGQGYRLVPDGTPAAADEDG